MAACSGVIVSGWQGDSMHVKTLAGRSTTMPPWFAKRSACPTKEKPVSSSIRVLRVDVHLVFAL